MAEHKSQILESHQTGRLDKVLATIWPELSRARYQQLIESGLVMVDGVTITDSSYKVKSGQSIEISIPKPAPARPEAQEIPLEILFEDQHLIVVNKPAGLVVHPAPGNPDKTLVNALLHHCGPSLTGIGGELRPGIVHRLDKDTSGIMVAAKTQACHQALSALFAEHNLTRRYLALVWGLPNPRSGTITGNIGRSSKDRKKMAVVQSGGRSAITHYEMVQTYAGGALSLVRCQLETGRTHQIRVHLSTKGFPVLGDPIYGRNKPMLLAKIKTEFRRNLAIFPRQALHACHLGFTHPVTGSELSFDLKLPADMKDLLSFLETL